jgi:hypothetical protein
VRAIQPVSKFVTLFAAGAWFLGGVANHSAMQAKCVDSRVVFEDTFDDDVLGAIPYSAKLPTGVFIGTQFGILVGDTSSEMNAVEVARDNAVGAAVDDNVLQLVDFDPLAGGCYFRAIPSTSYAQGSYNVRFTLQTKVGDGQFECSIIDNRTTPGTGRLIALAVDSTGEFQIGSTKSSFVLSPDVEYAVSVDLDFTQYAATWYQVTVVEVANPKTRFVSPLLRTINPGVEVSEILFRADAATAAEYAVDDLKVVAYD